MDRQASRAAPASEDRRDTEASEETGATTERTGSTGSTENRVYPGPTDLKELQVVLEMLVTPD